MNSNFIGMFAFIFLAILLLMIIFIPFALIFNLMYSRKLKSIISALPENAKEILREDINNEAARSVVYRIFGENVLKEDDFLNRLLTVKSFTEHLNNDDLHKCIKLKKLLKYTIKTLLLLLLVSVIAAPVALLLFY